MICKCALGFYETKIIKKTKKNDSFQNKKKVLKMIIQNKEEFFMEGQFSNDYGTVTISPDVIGTYAGSVAVECFGIVGMADVSVKDGLVKLLKKDYLNHGINVVINDNQEIRLDFHVIISYGVSIMSVTENLINTVKYRVEEFTGMKISKINILIEGVRVID